MSCTAKKVVATAIENVGYKESGTNINKFAAYIDKNYPNFYNGAKQGAEWCDVFVDYCVLVNSDNEAEAEYVLCQPKKSCGAGCRFSYDYYKEKGRSGKTAQIGAQIFFGSGKPKHTGIVVDVYGDSVVTVEGNSDNMVKRHTYKASSSKIYGYGYPRYAEETVADPSPSSPAPAEPTTPNPQKDVTSIAKEVIEGKWGNGNERKKKLTEAGYDYNVVQAEVNRLLKPSPTPSSPVETVTDQRTYTVKKGDSLWAISQKFLGKGSRYKEIKSLNGLKSDIIRVGQVLKLPAQ